MCHPTSLHDFRFRVLVLAPPLSLCILHLALGTYLSIVFALTLQNSTPDLRSALIIGGHRGHHDEKWSHLSCGEAFGVIFDP